MNQTVVVPYSPEEDIMKNETTIYSCFPRFPKKDKQVVFCVAHSPNWAIEPINTISIGTGDVQIYIHAYGKEGLQSVITALQGLTESLCEQLKEYTDNENNVKVSN